MKSFKQNCEVWDLTTGQQWLLSITITSGQRNLTETPHRHRTWSVQSYSPHGASVHPHLTHASLGPPESMPQTVSRSVWLFLHHSSEQKVPILYNGPPLSPQNCPFAWEISTLSNTVHNPNGITIASAVFAGLTIVTDRQTDTQTTLLRLNE